MYLLDLNLLFFVYFKQSFYYMSLLVFFLITSNLSFLPFSYFPLPISFQIS
uniref:Uncharacterized protein n=1 Tax=Jakoba libera TaxID=143017 RepID=M4Q9Y2_JAKLI|nr:hypothetical protein L048_p039 [Jakoba libera]AGH24217.1 hypothetical protein [Jakoba libera]